MWNFQRRATQIETLFGHQEGITALDAVQSDVVLSAAADRTVRLWKVADPTTNPNPNPDPDPNPNPGPGPGPGPGPDPDPNPDPDPDPNPNPDPNLTLTLTLTPNQVADESQLVYRGHTAPIDCVAQLAANAFVSGSQDVGRTGARTLDDHARLLGGCGSDRAT